MSKLFKLLYQDNKTSARSGILHTDHGKIETPCFMPVGTYGAIKTQSSEEIKNLPSNIILSNTYHLYLRPGIEILKKFGGLHKFMNWDGAILTDSGGYQVFSLSKFRKILSDGIKFRSHLDGSEHYFNPEKIIDIQRIIGSDLMMMLDVCPSSTADNKTLKEALILTTEWAKRAMAYYKNSSPHYSHQQVLIPIIQGGINKEFRKQSAMDLLELNAQAYAIGGLAVGESKKEMLKVVEWMNDLLPKTKPRYLMGVGTPSDLVRNIARGVDMFDCVIPTRNARNGQLFTYDGKLNIRNSRYKYDLEKIDTSGFSKISTIYSKSYLHHLFKTEEILGYRIATEHNLSFYINLLNQIKLEIKKNSFYNWAKEFLYRYEQDSQSSI